VIIQGEAFQSFNPLTVEELLNAHNPLVVLSVVIEGYRRLKADEAGRESEHLRTRAFQQVSTLENLIQPIPRPAARVDLVGLIVTTVFQVATVLVDEVPNQGVHIVFCPGEPVLNRRLDVPDTVAVKLGWVHLIDLILLTVLTAVDSSEHNRIGVEVMPIELPAIRQLKDPLSDLKDRSVNFVKEENHWLFAGLLEPVWRIEGGAIPIYTGETNQVTLGHLAGSALNNWEPHVLGDLIDHLRLTNTVASSKDYWQTSFAHCGS
jgi:hypothetical protein